MNTTSRAILSIRLELDDFCLAGNSLVVNVSWTSVFTVKSLAEKNEFKMWTIVDAIAFLVYGLTHSALGLYGRFVVLLRLWYSHSLIRVSIQPKSWYTHPQGNFTVFCSSVFTMLYLAFVIASSILSYWMLISVINLIRLFKSNHLFWATSTWIKKKMLGCSQNTTKSRNFHHPQNRNLN